MRLLNEASPMFARMKAPTIAALGSFVLVSIWSSSIVAQQQTSPAAKQPLEYIESSSPIPGGGVVSSVYIPGQSGPVYRQSPGNQAPTSNTIPNNINAGSRTNGNSGGGQSVLDSALSASQAQGQSQSAARQAYQPNLPNLANSQRVASANNTPVYGQPPQAATQYRNQIPVTAYQVPAASQIPSLGVPTRLDRSIRPNHSCAGCGPGAGYVPYGFQGAQPGAQTYYQQPPVAPTYGQAFAPPVAGPTGQAGSRGYFQQPGRSTYTPLFQLQNFPANAYAGQGIIGSPKLYVDGQPIRNLMRYLWIP